ncbi:MAG: HipA domain-containing protein [Alistipes sp.]|nr:HipA domain-containing protein [Alistipes sp.]
MKTLTVCPGHLAEGFDRYCPSCTRRLFYGKRVSPLLDFDYDADSMDMADSINQLSVSGVQEKLSTVVSDGKIVLTPVGGQGRYIIKPAPTYKHLRFRDQIPANEHLTMQIARRVYKIPTAENGLVFFKNGAPAYITRRFDYDADGNKIKQEDFASLAHKTGATHGRDFKYTGSYEDAASLIRSNVAAWQVQMSRFFALVVFNYLFANGDAHLKNFSLQQSPGGDYLLAPAYDLLNTSIHVADEDFALQGGLIPKAEYSDVYRRTGHPCRTDFETFGRRIGVLPKKMVAILDLFMQEQSEVYALTDRSFLDEKVKRMYKRSYRERWSRFGRYD